MVNKIKSWFKRDCRSCTIKQAEVEYWRDRVKHHEKIEADQRKVADTFERRYDELVARNEQDKKKQRFAVINDIKEYADPLPIDSVARKNVVARIAGWFESELGMQIRHLISRMEKEVARFPLSEREADFHRAGINFGYLLLEWGDQMISEHHANVAGKEATQDAFGLPSQEEEDEAVENIRSKIK